MEIVLALFFIFKYWYIILPVFVLLLLIAASFDASKERQQKARIEAQEQARKRAAERREKERKEREQQRYEEQARKRAEQQYREQQAQIEKEQKRQAAQLQKEIARREKEQSLSEHRLFVAEQRRLMTDSLRYDILARDGFRCQICGITAAEGAKLHVDHIFPVSKGGKTEPNNLRTLCERCNLGKSDKIESLSAPPVTPAQISNSTPHYTADELKSILTSRNIKWVDHRDRGGCLWIELTDESQKILEQSLVDGKPIYHASKSKAFGNNPALFVK